MSSQYGPSIEFYGKHADNLEISPLESVEMLHMRSKLENVIHELADEEKLQLWNYDLNLIHNAKLMAGHIGKVYDFSLSDKPLSEWWWHLDLVASGKIPFNFDVDDDDSGELE